MARTKKKPTGTPESAAALAAAMNGNQIPERPPGDTIEQRAEGDKPKKRGKKQPDLPEMRGPGVGRQEFPDIEEAADDFVQKRDAWQSAHEPMMAAKAKLLAAMKSHGCNRYSYDGKEVVVNPPGDETVKVRKLPDHQIAVGED